MRILVVKEKDGDTFYNASTDDILYDNALYHLKNVTMTYFDESTPVKTINSTEVAIRDGNGKLAWAILRGRNDHEYEEVEVRQVFDFSLKN